MAPLKGLASYKKVAGNVVLSADRQTVSWTPLDPPNAPPSLTLAVSSFTNLRQAVASSAKIMLKIVTQPPGASAPVDYVFTFTSPQSAKTEADAIRDALSVAIQAHKSGSGLSPAPTNGQPPPALAVANAVSTAAPDRANASGWYDDVRLKSDIELQKSLLKADPGLQKTFMESLRTKPESISNAQFTNQFWSTRIPLLRAHAIEKNQSRGAYNVLSTIRSRTEDNVTRLSISKEQIQLIFNQHPLVKRVYDENVPKINESAFWSKFFQSRLFKKLKGEKIVDSDPFDPILDKYLRDNEDPDRSKRMQDVHVPHIIDIEGNEENHSQRKGNQPDLTMRPSALDKAPIIRTLNTLSERIMADVTPIDAQTTKVAEGEDTFRELALHDLEGDAKTNRIILNVKDQQRFLSEGAQKDDSNDISRNATTQNPAQMLKALKKDLSKSMNGHGGLDLEQAIGVDENSDSDDEMHQRPAHVGSRSSIAQANKQILTAIKQRKAQTDDLYSRSSVSKTTSTAPVVPPDMSPALFDRVTLTHATTTEFLHHFWMVFLSGDPNRAEEVAALAESLDRAMTRVEAVIKDADEERGKEVERRRKEAMARYQQTGKKVKFNVDSIGGGSVVVRRMLEPTIKAVEFARTQYRKALAAAMAEGNGTVAA
ncbi:MAG: hypothetical protein M1823_005183 [Watsoniomyces obsoletus]|nr:MAG: hypothetical protein M1823_005183 [Watsoniomyces obsoletus]